MSDQANNGDYQTLVIDDGRDQLVEGLQRSSPARRVAAHNSVIELVGRSQALAEVMKQGGQVSNTDLPPLRECSSGANPANTPEDGANDDWVSLSEIEGRYVARVLEHTRGNKQAAARVLEIDRKTLDRMIKRHHIATQRARGPRKSPTEDSADHADRSAQSA